MAVSSINSSNGSSFSFDGVVSNLSTSDIITKLMSLEQGQLNGLTTRKQSLQARDAAYQSILAKVSTFQSAVSTLMLSSGVNARTTTSSAPTQVTATAGSDAATGSFVVKVTHTATASSVSSSRVDPKWGTVQTLGPGIDQTAPLSAAGFALQPTAGTFTINGKQITVATNQTLNDVVAAINDPATATGVTASVVNDTNGRAIGLQLKSNTAGTLVSLGASGDTSNFLTGTGLLGAPQVVDGAGVYTVPSSTLLGAAMPNAALSSANLGVTPTLANGATSGTLTINGVAITWSPSDTLTGLINRINTSAAGVRASYDPTSDRFSLTNSATGAQSISLSEDSNSNILEALGLKTATQKYGQVAQYQISTDGGTTFGTMQYSNSNTLSSVMPGVSLSLLSDPGATPSTTTITVGQDTAATQRNLQTFVDGFNALVDAVDQATQYDPTNKKASALTGDSAITGVAAQIRSLVADAALDVNKTLGKYSTLASIGISTGAIGSKPGTTDHLSLDQTKLTAALQDNPLAVQQLLNGLTSTTTLSQGGTQWVSSISGSPTGQLTDASYALSLTYDPNAPPGSISAIKTANGVASPAVTGTIAAGGSNSTLIPGLTINALANPPSGTTAGTTIQYTVQTRGVLQRLNDYLKSAVGSGGVFASEKDSETQESRDIDSQISYQNDLLAQKQAALQAQFTAMEVALSKLNSQSSSLMGSLASLSSSSK